MQLTAEDEEIVAAAKYNGPGWCSGALGVQSQSWLGEGKGVALQPSCWQRSTKDCVGCKVGARIWLVSLCLCCGFYWDKSSGPHKGQHQVGHFWAILLSSRTGLPAGFGLHQAHTMAHMAYRSSLLLFPPPPPPPLYPPPSHGFLLPCALFCSRCVPLPTRPRNHVLPPPPPLLSPPV